MTTNGLTSLAYKAFTMWGRGRRGKRRDRAGPGRGQLAAPGKLPPMPTAINLQQAFLGRLLCVHCVQNPVPGMWGMQAWIPLRLFINISNFITHDDTLQVPKISHLLFIYAFISQIHSFKKYLLFCVRYSWALGIQQRLHEGWRETSNKIVNYVVY